MVLFTSEQSLIKLQGLLQREIASHAGVEQGSAESRQAALLQLLLNTCSLSLSVVCGADRAESAEARACSGPAPTTPPLLLLTRVISLQRGPIEAALRDTKELYHDAIRLEAAKAVNFAEQLHSTLAQLRPFLAASDEAATGSARRESEGDPAACSAALAGAHSAEGKASRDGLKASRRTPGAVTIAAFEILKPISRGAYGHVVLAAKKTTRDLYAIKVAHPHPHPLPTPRRALPRGICL